MSTKKLLNSFGMQQILYRQSVNLATCFGSLSHHQASSQTILKVHSVHVHIVGSQMFTNHMTTKGRNDCLVASIIL
jgi:DNA-binding ferritin-like protein